MYAYPGNWFNPVTYIYLLNIYVPVLQFFH